MISSIADAIIALINSKPQSPTKAEIEEVLNEHMIRHVLVPVPSRITCSIG
jgi:hypothetical protein